MIHFVFILFVFVFSAVCAADPFAGLYEHAKLKWIEKAKSKKTVDKKFGYQFRTNGTSFAQLGTRDALKFRGDVKFEGAGLLPEDIRRLLNRFDQAMQDCARRRADLNRTPVTEAGYILPEDAAGNFLSLEECLKNEDWLRQATAMFKRVATEIGFDSDEYAREQIKAMRSQMHNQAALKAGTSTMVRNPYAKTPVKGDKP